MLLKCCRIMMLGAGHKIFGAALSSAGRLEAG